MKTRHIPYVQECIKLASCGDMAALHGAIVVSRRGEILSKGT